VATQVRTEGERIANLEGQIAHLATKADISTLTAKLNTLMWILAIAVPAAIAITGIVVGIVAQVLNILTSW